MRAYLNIASLLCSKCREPMGFCDMDETVMCNNLHCEMYGERFRWPTVEVEKVVMPAATDALRKSLDRAEEKDGKVVCNLIDLVYEIGRSGILKDDPKLEMAFDEYVRKRFEETQRAEAPDPVDGVRKVSRLGLFKCPSCHCTIKAMVSVELQEER